MKKYSLALVALALTIGPMVPEGAKGAEAPKDSAQAVVWSVETSRERPMEFADYVLAQVQDELDTKTAAEKELAARIDDLSAKIREQAKLRVAAKERAVDLRARCDSGVFPVSFAGGDYPDQDTVVQQISLLLAQCDSYDATIKDLKRLRRAAIREREALVTDIEDLQARIEVVKLQQARLIAKASQGQARQLLTMLDRLLPRYSAELTTHEQRVTQFMQGQNETPEQNARRRQENKAPSPPKKQKVGKNEVAQRRPIFQQF